MSNEEINKEIPAQVGTDNEPGKKPKPKVIVTILKTAGYIFSYFLLQNIWGAIFVLITIAQYRPDFDDRWSM